MIRTTAAVLCLSLGAGACASPPRLDPLPPLPEPDYHVDYSVRSREDLDHLLTGVARERPVSVPVLVPDAQPWTPLGLICIDDRPGRFVRIDSYWTDFDDVEENRRRATRIAEHNRALLARGALDPALGCTRSSDY